MVKDCGHHGSNKKKVYNKIALVILVFANIGMLVLILYLVYRPQPPQFTLQDVTVYTLNLANTAELTSNIEFTVKVKNPNGRDGITYDKLKSYATYHDQQITLPTKLPSGNLDTGDTKLWSALLGGQSIPIAPYIGDEINQDSMIGGIKLLIKLNGRVRWKLGSFMTTGTYHLHVSCDAVIPLGSNATINGVLVGDNAVKCQLGHSCSVSV